MSRAARAIGNETGVEFEVLAALDRELVDAIAREAVARGADWIVLADPRASGLGGLERRRLGRRSAIAVSA
jgi:Arc/MetJ family transcription regulator